MQPLSFPRLPVAGDEAASNEAASTPFEPQASQQVILTPTIVILSERNESKDLRFSPPAQPIHPNATSTVV
ncbi:MAG: hypothetical protein WBD10_09005, partial [Acidobacteriaceae bacterium]